MRQANGEPPQLSEMRKRVVLLAEALASDANSAQSWDDLWNVCDVNADSLKRLADEMPDPDETVS